MGLKEDEFFTKFYKNRLCLSFLLSYCLGILLKVTYLLSSATGGGQNIKRPIYFGNSKLWMSKVTKIQLYTSNWYTYNWILVTFNIYNFEFPILRRQSQKDALDIASTAGILL